jgi:hypothetical protein
MLSGGKNHNKRADGLAYDGCSCHNSKTAHRKAKKAIKQAEKKHWKKDQELP